MKMFELLLPVAILGLSACVVDDDTAGTTDVEQGLMGAPLDSTHTFAVGFCIGNLNPSGQCISTTGNPTSACSATLIAPNLVLTARHCIHTMAPDDGVENPGFCDQHFTTDPFRPGPMRVTTASSVRVGTPTWYDVTRSWVPSDAGICNNDLALLQLAANIPATEAYVAAPDLERNLAEDPPSELAIVGRGFVELTMAIDPATGDVAGVSTFDRGDLQRRILEHVPFECASDVDFGCTVVDHSTPGSHLFALTRGQALAGPSGLNGDSGSGWLRQREIDRRNPRVIGVTSWGTWGPDGHSNATGFIRLDIHRDLIRSAGRDAAAAGGYRTPSWARCDDDHDD